MPPLRSPHTPTTPAPSTSTPSTSTFSVPLEHANQEANPKLKAAVFQRLHPQVYLEKYLAEGVRVDGRGLSEEDEEEEEDETARDGFRSVYVNVGSISTADGSALVRLGDTTIVCGVKAEIAEPELDRPNEGFLVPNLDLPAMCSPKFKPGPPSDDAQILSERLHQALVASNILPLTSLCIHPGKAVWTLYVDATCINYNGNAFDAALLAMVLALKNTKLPEPLYNPETGATICSRSKPRLPLALAPVDAFPIPASFGIFNSKHILPDTTSFEEPLCQSSISVVLAAGGKIVALTQYGPVSLINADEGSERDALKTCIEKAKKRRDAVVRKAFNEEGLS
ncbi:ribosomal protein S5 domain 2-type protein [Panaeolus papilionaceus]|nr:ribosomal protein S5 domain 2-type protein [Panaeolus papilionaceus]